MKYTLAIFAPLITVSAITLSSSSLFAASEFIPLQEFAQGQSLTGANLLNDSLYVNPAASAFTDVYSVDGTYQLSKKYAVSVLDTKNGTVDGALGYFRQPVNNLNEGKGGTYVENMQCVKGALSGRVSTEIAVGIAGKALWGPNQTTSNQDRMNAIDLGILANLGPFQLGGTAYNVIGGNPSMNTHYGQEFSVGARYGYQDLFFLSVATQSRFSDLAPYQYGFGAEYVSPYYFSLKGGYRTVNEDAKHGHLAEHTSYWSAGVGINSPRLSVSYGVQFPQQNSMYDKIEHEIGVMFLL